MCWGVTRKLNEAPQSAIVEHYRHLDAQGTSILLDLLQRIIESDVDRDDRQIRFRGLVGVLEVRHLQTTGHTPSGPELEVDGLLAVERAQIDGIAIDGLDHGPRRGCSHESLARELGALLAGGVRRPRERGSHGHQRTDEYTNAHPSPDPHGAAFPATLREAGLSLSLIMKTRILAVCV